MHIKTRKGFAHSGSVRFLCNVGQKRLFHPRAHANRLSYGAVNFFPRDLDAALPVCSQLAFERDRIIVIHK